MEVEKLDNPAWYSLTETHKDFCIDYNGVKFYNPSNCLFGGFLADETTKAGIDKYALLTDHFFVIGEKPNYSSSIRLKKELVCYQMLIEKRIDMDICEDITKLQTAKQKAELWDLVNLVQPGYFKKKTTELGRYYGIYKNDRLIAVTGERMKMNKFTEVSAVITHPEHTGKGYAKQSVAYTTNKIFDEQKEPYLHVADTNIAAIRLYEKLGFKTRRKISFWHFLTVQNK